MEEQIALQANGVSNGQITYEPFPRSNSSATIRSPMPFLPQIPPAVRFPSSHSATDFRRFPFNNAPRLPYRYPQLVTGSGHSSASSLNSSMSLRSLTAQTEAPPPNLLIDLQEQKGPSASNNMTDVIFDPLLDPSRVAAKVAVIEQRSLPAQGKNSSMSPPLPAKPSREMPVIKPLTENFQSNLVAAGQQPVVNRNGWEKFD